MIKKLEQPGYCPLEGDDNELDYIKETELTLEYLRDQRDILHYDTKFLQEYKSSLTNALSQLQFDYNGLDKRYHDQLDMIKKINSLPRPLKWFIQTFYK